MPTRIAARYMFVSGMAALVYEVLWTRDLAYVFGASAQALSAVVAAFLAGLALGAWFAGRRVRPEPGMLRAYALLEVAIAVTAPLVPWLVVALDRALLDPLWPWIEAHDAQVAARFLAAFLVMLPATACMGATLPVLCAAFAGGRDESGAVIGRLYGWNTLGGAAGCLFAGFVLIEQVGLWKSRFVAAGFNVALAFCALRLAARAPAAAAAEPARPLARSAAATPSRPRDVVSWPVWALALLLTSAASIALELCWSRLVALAVGGTAYAFSIVLAVYLLGLGGGALVYGAAARRRVSPLLLVGVSQVALAVALLVTRPLIEPLLLHVATRLYEGGAEGHAPPLYLRPGLGLLFSASAALVPALLLGIAFPALSDLKIARREEIGSRLGAAYLVSTIGGAAASILTTFLLLPTRGLEVTIGYAALAAGAVGSLLLAARGGVRARTLAVGGGALAVTLLLFVGGRSRFRWEGRTIYGGIALYGPRARGVERQLLSAQDGPSCSVAVFEHHGERSLSVNGKVDASTRGDMGTQLLLAWLPQLFHDESKEAFVLGWGAGVTTAAARRYGARVQCAEIEPGVLAVANLFAEVNDGADRDPGVELVVDDGRSLLRRGRRRFDVITTEPSNPWLAGMANLFTVEFYELCRSRLTDDGVLCQWVQLYWSSPEDYRAIFATLGSVFPHVAIWKTTSGDTLMLGSMRPLRLDPVAVARRVEQRPWLAGALAASGSPRAAAAPVVAQLARMELLEGEEARAYADSGARRISDDVPFLEFSAARRMHANSNEAILDEVLKRRKTPLYSMEELAAALPAAEFALVLRDVAASHLLNGAAELAEPLLEEAGRRAPRLEQLPFWRWLSSRRRGRVDEAAQRLALLEKEAPALLLQVAEEHRLAREFDAASAALDRLERRLGLSAGCEYERGQVRESQGQRVDAAAHYERALKIDPGYADARNALRKMRDSR